MYNLYINMFNLPKISKEKARQIAFYSSLSIFIILIGISIFYFGYQAGVKNPKTISIENVSNIQSNEGLQANFGIFWEAWDMLKKEHLKGGTAKDQDLIYGAVSGLVNSLKDPNTNFFPPEDSKKFEQDVNGNFGGIGAEISVKKDQLIVMAPLKGNPAEKAGLKAGDKILAINDKSTQGIDVNEAVKRIRGEIGTEVKLTIFRDGWDKIKDFKIARANIEVPTLESDLIKKNGKQIADIKLFSFNQNAPVAFYKAALSALVGKSDGIILDLRNDPGGFLEVAVNIAGWFLNKGEIVAKEKFRSGNEIIFRANGNESLKNIPVVVLVNKGSASASEILAGTLRANLGAKLIGTNTYGKGTVQELRNLSDGSKIKLTIANWVLPDGTIIDENGIKPDYQIDITDEDLKNKDPKYDPQFNKAVEVLLQEINKK